MHDFVFLENQNHPNDVKKKKKLVFGTPRSHPGNRLRHSHTLEISANVSYFGVTGRALLMSPKGRNASRDGFVKFVVADVCLNSPVIS